MKISASIYSDKKRSLKETIQDLEEHQVDLLHVDCNDDVSVFDDIKALRKWTNIPVDLHIITETPEKYFDLLRNVPVEMVTFQFEQLPKGFKLPADIPGEKGLAIITPTDVSVFDEFSDYDFLLVMATIPGQSGGKFDPLNFSKIRKHVAKYPNKRIHVDGGVNGEVSFILRNMGVYASVSGSYLFNAPSVGKALLDLTKNDIESNFCVGDFMLPIEESPVCQSADLNLENVLKTIDEGRIGFCIIQNENKELSGIISNADLRKTILKNIKDLTGISAEQMVNKTPVTINEKSTVNEMLQLIKSKPFPIMYLPVVNSENHPVGIITFVNLVKGE